MRNINKSKINSRNIIFSSILSRLGNAVFDYGNNSILATLFPSNPFWLSMYQASENIVSIIINLFSGAIVDVRNRKKILMIMDILSGIICLLGLFFLNNQYILYIGIILANIALSILNTFSGPAYSAVIKETISTEYVETHFSHYSIWRELMSIVSPTVGVFILTISSIEYAYLFNAITFFIAAYITYKLELINGRDIKDDKNEKVFNSIKKGLEYTYGNKKILYLLFLSSFVNFFLSAYNLITPYMNQYYDDKMDNFYGISLMVQAIGSVVFSYLNKKHLSDKSWAKTEYFLILVGVFITCIGGIDYLFHNPIASLIPFFFVGGMLTVFNIRFFTTVQIEVEDEYIGRVYSVIFTIAVVFMPIGSLFFGKFMGVETLRLLIISGIGIVVTGIIYIFNKNKRSRI